MRLIDADALKEMLIKERDSIPLSKTERYSFGVGLPNPHGMAMRGGVNKAFRCMENAPTIDPESLRPQGEWIDLYGGEYANHRYACSACGIDALYKFEVDALGHEKAVQALSESCPNCGAKMKGADDHA